MKSGIRGPGTRKALWVLPFLLLPSGSHNSGSPGQISRSQGRSHGVWSLWCSRRVNAGRDSWWPTQHELRDSRRNAKVRLTFDLSLVSDWGRTYLILFNASKTQFLYLSVRHNLPNNYPHFFNDSQLPLSSTLNTLGLSFTKNLNLNWQFHISTLAKSTSKNLDVLWHLRPVFSSNSLLYTGTLSLLE